MNYFPLKPLRHSQYGVSLMDILLVFALISLLAGLATPNISKFINSYNLRIAVSDLSSFLQKAKIVAAKNNTEVDINFNPVGFTGYKIEDLNGNTIVAVSFNDCEHPVITFDKCYAGNILYEHPVSGENAVPEQLMIKPNGLARHGWAYITNVKKSKYYRIGMISAAGIVGTQKWNGEEWE